MRSLYSAILVQIFCAALGMGSAFAAEIRVNHDLFDNLLSRFVHNGVVDYKGFKTNEATLNAYLKVLEAVDPEALGRQEQFAFYIDAYNAWTIKLVLSGYPGIESIKDLGSWFSSPWKKKICRIGGKVISLDDIEHGILRPRFTDPRVHFAINCASKSCPPLRSEAYRGDRLNRQLDEAAADFLNDPKQNYLKNGALHVSKIFDWFGEDFKNGVYAFFLKYAKDEFKKDLEKVGPDVEIEYLDYDWGLNGT